MVEKLESSIKTNKNNRYNLSGILKSMVEFYWNLPVWFRIILGIIIGASFGSVFMLLVNQYALYSYSLSNNFRLPIEGVEYIKLSITLVSFAIFTVQIIWIYVFKSIVTLGLNYSLRKVDKKKFLSEKKLYILQRTILIIPFFIVVIPHMALLIFSFENISTSNKYSAIVIYLIMAIISSLNASILYSSVNNIKKKSLAINKASIVSTIFLILIMTSFMFNKQMYSDFLGKIKYGGKVPILVEYSSADNSLQTTYGLLLIRTNKYLIFQNKTDGNDILNHEIPMSRVSKVSLIEYDK